MKKTLILLSVLVFSMSFGACTKKTEEPSAQPEAPAAPEEPAAPAEAEEPEQAAPEAPAADTSSVGVPECDDYISKIQKCVADKVPPAAQAAMKQGFEKNIEAWKQAASTPQGKQSLAMACKTALDTAKQSMGVYGCEF